MQPCLKPPCDPVGSHHGHIFCKECIYQNLLTQKQHMARDLKAYEKAQDSKKARGLPSIFL
jgi:nitric oxide synthase-interacting protein